MRLSKETVELLALEGDAEARMVIQDYEAEGSLMPPFSVVHNFGFRHNHLCWCYAPKVKSGVHARVRR